MHEQYYTFPLHCAGLLSGQRQPQCDLSESIRRHIHLILRTHFHEYRFDPSYGCLVWQKDFEAIRSIHRWKEDLLDAFEKSVKKHEKRIANTEVAVELDELKLLDPNTRKVTEVRKRIAIHVKGRIRKTDELFLHTEHIFFSPLSLT